MFNGKKYVSREANEIVPIEIQVLMWSMIDELKEKTKVDYLQIFKISKHDDESISIEHKQEIPTYENRILVELEGVEIKGIIKIYVIDSVEYSTMILAEEY
ncbi:DUF960 family protein [Clostridium saccharoperbutylacetonicum]|uniref:DUF960 family protein n=1 Tax=Clostridium saccharoperbutylacetonicum TaxID=36745 RepID=UPI000983A143|nr:DUF960 family protein [Clostridium saccharoperbutylacetonicum]AQR98212.1 hypothetical protein CLSAP_55670 [Clostridium saccharoperbutylacetonicum]NSB34107.1 hypothetical protein [Clostridium saccharoperbutylacetonicum]